MDPSAPQSTAPAVVIRDADWQRDGDALRRVRMTVFVEEQHVPAEMELDEHDVVSHHALALSPQGDAVGTGRLLPDGHIGRMAVLATWRGRGVGGKLLEHLVAVARRQGKAEVVLSSQVHAIPFYERHGFVVEGPIYLDAGIEHRLMRRRLDL